MNINPEHIATEQRSFENILEGIDKKSKYAATVIFRLKQVFTFPDAPRFLDIGASSGSFLFACTQLGYRCDGVEPWAEARLNAINLSKHLNIPINIVDGTAESIPFNDNTFDLVHANSVIEHVIDVEKAFQEINRVLKSGGVFWFSTASSMCPRQGEIREFPLFGWYPDSLKVKIMNWAKNNKPHLIGYTKTPAINWFTSPKAHNLLYKHGFRHVHDRWDLRTKNEGGRLYEIVLRLIRLNKLTKTLADAAWPMCSFAAIKQ